MANRTKLIEDVARALRPDIFRWTKANYDKDLAVASWRSIELEQERLKGIIDEVLLNVEKVGFRIFNPEDFVSDQTVGFFDLIPTLYPRLQIHKKFRGKFFKRAYKSRRIPE